MKRFAFLIPAIALSLAYVLPPALAQPGGKQTSIAISLSGFGYLYLADPALQKELKLTELQVKKLLEQKYQLRDLAIGERSAASAAALDKAIAEILDPIQMSRLRQITMQQLARATQESTGLPLRSLVNSPDVVANLKITDDQKARIRAGVSLLDLVTADQLKIWNKMIGEPFSTFLQSGIGPGGSGGGSTVGTYAHRYLDDPVLQKELKLSEEQVKKFNDQRSQPGSYTTPIMEKLVAGILDPQQLNRLNQIAMQQLARGSLPATGVPLRTLVNSAELVAELKLTDEQKAKIGPGVQLTDLLTGDQKKIWTRIIGEPFAKPLKEILSGLPGGGGEPLKFNNYAVHYLGDPTLQRELQLSEEQQIKLNGHRQRGFSEGLDLAAINILEPTQVKRLHQITMQQMARGSQPASGAGLRALMNTPEVAAQLKLTDFQKTNVGRGVQLTDFLTDDQKRIWTKMIGEPFNEALVANVRFGGGGSGPIVGEFPGGLGGKKGDGPGGAPLPAPLPVTIYYLTQKSIVDELTLTENQVKKLADMKNQWTKLAPRNQVSFFLRSSFEKEAADQLDAAQAKRLKQILFRHSLGNFVDAEVQDLMVFSKAELLAELEVDNAQHAKFKAIQETRRTAMSPLFLTGESFEEITKALDAHDKATYTQLFAVLSPDQQAALKDRSGAPVKLGLQIPKQPGFRPRTLIGTSLIHLSIGGMLLVNNQSLHEELKLSETQVRHLVELRDRSFHRPPNLYASGSAQREISDKPVAQQAKEYEKELSAILDPKQLTRFKQVVVQYYVAQSALKAPKSKAGPGGIGASVPIVASVVEVIEGLTLSLDQKLQIVNGTPFVNVLNAKQRAKWQEMLGEPFESAGTLLSYRGVAEPAYLSTTSLLLANNPSIHVELKLTETQVDRMIELCDQYFARPVDANALWFNKAAADKSEKKRLQQSKDDEKALRDILAPEQFARYNQIVLQYYVARPKTKFDGNVAPSFGVGFNSGGGGGGVGFIPGSGGTYIFPPGSGGSGIDSGPLLPSQFVEVVNGLQLSKIQVERLQHGMTMAEVLDAKQKVKWQEMLGKPFEKAASLVWNQGTQSPAYLSIVGATLADNKLLHEELKLTDAQTKRMIALRVKAAAWQHESNAIRAPGLQAKQLALQAAEHKKELTEILNPQQLTRFKQIILQHIPKTLPENKGGRRGVPAVAQIVEVIEVLNLTRNQVERLQQGTTLVNTLDAKQQAKWTELLGEPFARAASLQQSSGNIESNFVENTHLPLLEEKSVQDELQLTPAQIAKLPELTRKWAELHWNPDGGELSGDNAAFAKWMARLELGMDKAIAGVLDAKQFARFEQIRLQHLHRLLYQITKTGAILLDASAQKRLGLQEDQLKKIDALQEGADKTIRLLRQRLYRDIDGKPDELFTKTSEAFDHITEKKQIAVLTATQLEAMRAMFGVPFNGKLNFPHRDNVLGGSGP